MSVQMVDAGMPAQRSSPSPRILGEQRDLPEICIFDAPESVEILAETLAKVGYRAVANPVVADLHSMSIGQEFAAAVILDGVQDPLKLAARVSAQCPVLYVTSEPSVETRLAAVRAGIDAILSRPLDLRQLAEWLNDRAVRHKERRLSVMVIDDDEILAATYALALENAGMRVLVETDAAGALLKIMTTQIDLILLDIHMPGVTGVELAAAVRQLRRFLPIPIVFLSVERDPVRQIEARRLGGDDFVSKPVDLRSLVSLVQMRADRAVALRNMMDRDSLTGLLNHGSFVDRLHHEMARCRRTGDELSLVFVDLDRFKNINDTYGHIFGDRVLQTLARVLTVGLRKADVVGRYGGEEFALLLLGASPEGACIAVDKVRRQFSQIEFRAKDSTFFVTFSAGVSGSRKCQTAEELISAADFNMYRAKATGRNRIVEKWSDNSKSPKE